MGMQSGGGSDDIVTGINVTPLVDVGLVLVIIFMVTAPLFEQPALQVELPKTNTEESKEEENVTITINPEGKIAINETEVSKAEFRSVLQAKLSMLVSKNVILKADKNAHHGELLFAMKAAKELGAQSMAIATEPKQGASARK